MDEQSIFKFEEKYPFLYDEMAQGVSVYTCLRDGVAARLEGEIQEISSNAEFEKGKIYLRRILGTIFKWRKYRKAETVIFTSSVYRRDKGRNLAAEFLLQKYPNGVVFEWPSRNENFDKAYFKDKKRYIPLDGYLLRYKLYCKLHKKEMQRQEEEGRKRLQDAFDKNAPIPDKYRSAVKYIIEELPRCLVATIASQRVFARMFRNYKNIRYAVDFWGSGRENIIPVLKGNPQSIELQHGLITSIHPGYVYPQFVKNVESALFKRKILVYATRDKDVLCKQSIYEDKQVEIVGNPRIERYKSLLAENKKEKKWVLFTSQPYEQDQAGVVYYSKILPYLQKLAEVIEKEGRYRLVIKLHPRENEGAQQLYKKAIPTAEIFGASSSLYELLGETYLHVTATSTVLFEGIEFDVPTVTVQFDNYNPKDIYGIETLHVDKPRRMEGVWRQLSDEQFYKSYLQSLKNRKE